MAASASFAAAAPAAARRASGSSWMPIAEIRCSSGGMTKCSSMAILPRTRISPPWRPAARYVSSILYDRRGEAPDQGGDCDRQDPRGDVRGEHPQPDGAAVLQPVAPVRLPVAQLAVF